MQCMKCGRECERAFCDKCLAGMEAYPVKPGTVVTLPDRKRYLERKPKRVVQASPEERIGQLKRRLHFARITIGVLLLLLVASCVGTIYHLRSHNAPVIGQNYSTVTQPTTEAAEEK